MKLYGNLHNRLAENNDYCEEIKVGEEFTGTFEDYIKDCCSKNGTLTEITKGEN